MNKDAAEKSTPSWLYILIGAMLALQIVQFILLGLLYLYIHSIEGRISNNIDQSRKEVIRYFDRR